MICVYVNGKSTTHCLSHSPYRCGMITQTAFGDNKSKSRSGSGMSPHPCPVRGNKRWNKFCAEHGFEYEV